MPIESRIYQPAGLTVHEIFGGISPAEFRETLHEFYKETGPTKNVLWDIRKAAWDMVPADSILEAVREAMQIYKVELGARKGGRTAVVVSNEMGMSFAKVAQRLLGDYQPPLPFVMRVFSDTTSANEWLSEGPRDA